MKSILTAWLCATGALIIGASFGASSEDTCTGETSVSLKETGAGVKQVYNEISKNLNCSSGGAEDGVVRGELLLRTEGIEV
jgi:hypothetical protein